MDKEESKALMAALRLAQKAFEKHLEKYNYDPSYFRLTMSVKVLDANFQETGEKLEWTTG